MKTRTRFGIKRIVSLTIGVGALSGSAFACDCGTTGSPKEALEKSAAVFSGKVINIKEDKQHVQLVQLKVIDGWKGVAQREVWVNPWWGTDCGYAFKKGKDYLVYANSPYNKKQPQFLVTTICTRTRALSDAKDDIVELGEAKYHPQDK